MKKISFVFLFLIAVLSPGILKAQAFQKNKIFLSFGYGVGNLGRTQFHNDFAPEMTSRLSHIGPLFGKIEFFAGDHLGMGFDLVYPDYINSCNGSYYDNNGDIIEFMREFEQISYSMLLRLNLHLSKSDRVDPCMGLGLRYRGSTYNEYSIHRQQEISTSVFPVGAEATMGIRFLFLDFVGAYLELGFAKAIIQGGITA